MQLIILTAVVDEKRRIMIDLPDDLPVGLIELVVRPLTPDNQHEMTREEMRARLIAAGLMTADVKYVSDDVEELSSEERERIGSILASAGSLSELIIQDREDRV
jgi:hypothetical protein